ncbi:Muscle M-line assembly protein unc-89 [Aphelenchoides bicaudatus]|nr:Muscle M-line assembly protein unc-89 [Aphelenchoides bicaudatus]
METSVERPSTTTISTIAVRAEPHTTIVIAMLKSLGDIELRIDEMKPRLLEIGSKLSETEHLLNSHNDLTTRLASKQQQVEELLTRADQLVTEQKDSEIFVYEAMAESLGFAWKDLNRQLELRGYILEDTQRFYRLANEHEKVFSNRLLFWLRMNRVHVWWQKMRKVMQRLYSLAKAGDPVKFILPLTQISRMAPEETHKTLFKLHGNYLKLLTETFSTCEGGTSQSDRLINVAYIFLNVSQLKQACVDLFGTLEGISSLSSFIINPTAITSFKCIVAKILLNISYHLDMHSFLLNDQFIADIVDPFADESDEISTEEMDKLPMQLQYVDHKRSQSVTLLETLVEVLARLCISKDGREHLRSSGIYVILREFDKARRGSGEQLVDDKFMSLDGTPEWNLLMHTLLFDDHEIQAEGDLEHQLPQGITEFNLDELAAELDLIESETRTASEEKLVGKTHHFLKELISKHEQKNTVQKIKESVDELIDTTANAVDLGSSIITQLRTLGALADNQQRPAEVLESCLLIENVMLNMGTEWEIVESLWYEEKEKLQDASPQVAPRSDKQLNNKLGTQLNYLDTFLQSVRKRVQKDPNVAPNILAEAKTQRENLYKLSAEIRLNSAQSPLDIKAQQLEQAFNQFISQLEAGDQTASRLDQFLQNADSILNQLEQMKRELQNASPAVAGELGPLARQKASSVISDGEQLLQHGQTPENQQKVTEKLEKLNKLVNEVQQLARQRIEGNSRLFEQVQQLAVWLREHAEPFLANNGNLGADSTTAQEFAQAHWTFATDLINKEFAVNSILTQAHELSDEGRENAKFMYSSYESVKQVLETRIKLANTFKNAYKFGTDLDKSLYTISTLLDQNAQNFGDETVAKQMNNLFYAIQSTLAQEKHQAEKFLETAKESAQNDLHLNSDQAIDTIVATLEAHEKKFEELKNRFQEYQDRRQLFQRSFQTIEEVQMWQVDTSELISRLEQKTHQTNSDQTRDEVSRAIKTLLLREQSEKLNEAFKVFQQGQQNEQTAKRFADVKQQQEQLERRIQNILQQQYSEQTREQITTISQQEQQPLESKQTVRHEIHIQSTSPPDARPPSLISPLDDAQVEEGQRFEFKVKVDGNPEPRIDWIKEGQEIRGSSDYRCSFLNGVATLTIEETFIEDTGVFIFKATNPLGVVEKSAKLTVNSKNRPNQTTENTAEKPRFVRQLQNVVVDEGSSAQPGMCNSSKTGASEYTGDRCLLNILDARPEDSGLYKVKAQNTYGETTNFCRLNVNPRGGSQFQPPGAAFGQHKPPNFQPSLVNQVVREGEPATVQVRVSGEPKPRINWTLDDKPIQESENVRVTFEPDGWTRVQINRVGPENIGLYMITASNESGEARTGATLNAIPAHVLQAGTNTQQHHINRGSTTTTTREHTVQIQQQQEPRQIPAVYNQQAQTQADKQRMLQHQIIQQAASTRFPVSDEISDFGFSSLANGPQFIRPFAPEYTINEGEKASIDCLMVANPRPKIQWFFNDAPIKSNWQFAEFKNIGDSYSIELSPAKLENAGFYRMVAENIKGKTESIALIHVRPRSMIPQPTPTRRTPQHRIVQDFGGTDYGIKLYGQSTPPPQKRYASNVQQQQQMSVSAYQPRGEVYQNVELPRQNTGQPPHFISTLSSCVAITGDLSRFEAVVTGLPAPEIEWFKDSEPISPATHL